MTDTRHICLACEQFWPESALLEPEWYRSLPREQRGITTPEVACPECGADGELISVADLREAS